MIKTLTFQRLVTIACTILVLLSVSGCSLLGNGASNSPTLPKKQVDTQVDTNILTILRQSSYRTSSIPSSMIGMNIEMIDLCLILQTDAIHQESYEQLFRNFGTGTLHIAGHSADMSIWEPNAKPVCEQPHTIVTKTLVRKIFTFARRIHWNVIWGLSLINDNPNSYADQAQYVTEVGQGVLVGFSIGNEPELYAKHNYRPAGWSLSDYISEWENNRNAVLAKVPGAKFIGPDAIEDIWMERFIATPSISNSLLECARHYYFYSGGSHTGITPASLLDPSTTRRFAVEANQWVADANAYRLPMAVTETNTISNGGIAGVSNSFAATLWTSDILFQAAKVGIQQVDFQEVPGASYAFINRQGQAQLVYYGLLFFNIAATQATPLVSNLSTSQNVSAYVLQGADGKLRVVIINKEPQHGIQIVMSAGNYRTMTTLRMQAPSLGATKGVTLSNTSIASNGTFTIPNQASTPVQSGQAILNVPASSAALFTFSA